MDNNIIPSNFIKLQNLLDKKTRKNNRLKGTQIRAISSRLPDEINARNASKIYSTNQLVLDAKKSKRIVPVDRKGKNQKNCVSVQVRKVRRNALPYSVPYNRGLMAYRV